MGRKLSKKITIGVFVTSHGFGHGTRICAVLNEIITSISCEFIIVSFLPEWFFRQNLPKKTNFMHIKYQADVGLVQNDPFHHSLTKTQKELDKFLSFEQDSTFKEVVTSIEKCEAIISDISPLGIHIGRQVGIPTILIENFTWDWIYEKYLEEFPDFQKHIGKLSNIYKSVDLHIQATPFCKPNANAIKVPPIFRKHREKQHILRKSLLNSPADKLILVTTGGISKSFEYSKMLLSQKSCTFVLSSNKPKLVRKGNIIFLPVNSGFHYPDIVRASDLVVGKVGYGTLAECWSANIPILGCYRDDFRESEKLEDFARQHLFSESITLKELENGWWLTRAMDIQPSREYGKTSDRRSGSESAAKEIINFMIETVKNSGN